MKRKYLFVICMLLLCGCADGTDSLESSRVDTLQSTGESSLIDIVPPQQTTPPQPRERTQ